MLNVCAHGESTSPSTLSPKSLGAMQLHREYQKILAVIADTILLPLPVL